MSLKSKDKDFPRRITLTEVKTMKNGFRKYFAPNGDEYTGFWRNDKKHGWGLQVWKKTGNTYNGEWMFGKREGYGSYSVWDKDEQDHRLQYEGHWKEGQKHGYGTFYYNSGDIYEGEWCENQRDGRGMMHYANGKTYHGEWKKGQRTGKGIIQYSNGDWYEGEWKDGVEHGKGTLYYIHQFKYFRGLFENGKPTDGELVTYTEVKLPCEEMVLQDIEELPDLCLNPYSDSDRKM